MGERARRIAAVGRQCFASPHLRRAPVRQHAPAHWSLHCFTAGGVPIQDAAAGGRGKRGGAGGLAGAPRPVTEQVAKQLKEYRQKMASYR